MAQDLEGRHVVVTGASGGLGIAIVEELLARHASCHLPFVEPDVPARVPWSRHDRVQIQCGVDVGDEAQARDFYAAAPALWASVHLVGGFSMGPLLDSSLADLEHMLALNVRTCFLCCRESVRAMRRGGEGGRIVNVTARPALEPVADMSAYSAAKGGVAALTRSLAAELREEGILVNAIVPSIIDTPANRSAMPDADFDRWPTPSQIADAIGFLVSPGNALTHGALLPVYGRA